MLDRRIGVPAYQVGIGVSACRHPEAGKGAKPRVYPGICLERLALNWSFVRGAAGLDEISYERLMIVNAFRSSAAARQ